MVVAKVRERLAVSKEVMKKSYQWSSSLKKLNEVEDKLAAWKIWMMMQILIELRKLLEKI
jgi:hypothetical protein